MHSEPVLQALSYAWGTLQKTGAPIAIMGGMAVAVWEHLRATKDVDFLIGIDAAEIDDALERLRSAGIRTKHHPAILRIADLRIIQLLYEPPDTFLDIQIDLLLADSKFQQAALARRVPVRLPRIDLEVSVIACEDLILFKLIAGRIIDRADSAALLRANQKMLDLSYLGKWIRELRLGREFADAWGDAFPGIRIPNEIRFAPTE